jgi:hypothetical protein
MGTGFKKIFTPISATGRDKEVRPLKQLLTGLPNTNDITVSVQKVVKY